MKIIMNKYIRKARNPGIYGTSILPLPKNHSSFIAMQGVFVIPTIRTAAKKTTEQQEKTDARKHRLFSYRH